MCEDEAIAILSSPDSYASIRAIEPQGVSIIVVAQKTKLLPLAGLGAVVGLLVLLAGIYLLWHPQSELPRGGVPSDAVKLIMMGCLVLAVAPLIAVIQLVNGPPRNVEFEATPGTLKADRSISGDRVVSTYGVQEVSCLFNEGNVLFIETRKGPSQLIAFGRRPINEAVAFVIARHFWFPLEIDIVRLAKGALGHRIERTVFTPKACLRGQ